MGEKSLLGEQWNLSRLSDSSYADPKLWRGVDLDDAAEIHIAVHILCIWPCFR